MTKESKKSNQFHKALYNWLFGEAKRVDGLRRDCGFFSKKNGALTSVSTPFKTNVDLITKKDSWQPQGSSRPEEDDGKTYTLKDHKFHHAMVDLPQRPVRGHPL